MERQRQHRYLVEHLDLVFQLPYHEIKSLIFAKETHYVAYMQ